MVRALTVPQKLSQSPPTRELPQPADEVLPPIHAPWQIERSAENNPIHVSQDSPDGTQPSLPDFSALCLDRGGDDSLPSSLQSFENLPVFLDQSTGSEVANLKSLVGQLTRENKELLSCLTETNSLLVKLDQDQVENNEKFHRLSTRCGQTNKDNAETNGGTVEDTSNKTNIKENGTKNDNKKSEKKNQDKNGTIKNGVGSDQFQTIQIKNLSSQLDVAEDAQAQLSQDLQRVTGEKLDVQNQLTLLTQEQDQLKATVEQLTKDKWEANAVNNDLQQRLQQTVALAHMQAEGNQSRLQEEVGKMLFQLEEERKVTANLSRNLELERRKVESLEQRAKSVGTGSNRGSTKGEKSRSSLIPDEVVDCETKLSQSMEVYRQRCDNLGLSLASFQAKLEDERYCGDLVTEVTKLRKLLSEEKRKSHGEIVKLTDTHKLFDQVYLEYGQLMENVRQTHHEKKMKSQHQSVLSNIAESNMRDNVDSMTARLMQAEQAVDGMTARLMQNEEALQQERASSHLAREKLTQAKLDIDSLPLLQAQVEVYRSDFNAERNARERIAGEKADLEEQLRNAGVHINDLGTCNPGVLPNRGTGTQGVMPTRGTGSQGIVVPEKEERHNYPNIPRTVNTRPEIGAEKAEEMKFNCPKCNREFRNTTLLTRHVNDCLDRD